MNGRIAYRDLTSLDQFARVVELERDIWGPRYGEVVPVPILAVTVKRGGVLIGAFAGQSMVGFVYSLPGIRDGRATEWSHMLGVLPEYRGSGIGLQLKRLQRERALTLGVDLIEWTFDPLQTVNAHLNFSRLGAVAEEYEVNIYGESSSPLHRNNPTDRLVAEWWIRDRRVEDRLNGTAPLAPVLVVEPANRPTRAGDWLEPGDLNLSLDDRRVSIAVPAGFTGMLERAPDLAREWRTGTRRLFTTYFERGYRAVDFFLDEPAGTGSYLLVRSRE